MKRARTPTRRPVALTPERKAAIEIDRITVRNLCNQACVYHVPLSFATAVEIGGRTYRLQSSSATIIHAPADTAAPQGTRFIVNIRAVNYHLDDAGNIINNDGRADIMTLNKVVYLDRQFVPIAEKWVPMEPRNVPYNGVEDVRLFVVPTTGEVKYTGSYYTCADKIGIVMGTVGDIAAPTYPPLSVTPAFETDNTWEKNWVMFGGDLAPPYDTPHVIYKWSPLHICRTEGDKLLLEKTAKMPPIFEKFRGSTNGVTYKGRVWFIVHFHHISPADGKRWYLHCFVVFGPDMELVGYSAPFNFRGRRVEYCIGMIENNDNFIMTYSTLDRTTDLAVISVATVAQMVGVC